MLEFLISFLTTLGASPVRLDKHNTHPSTGFRTSTPFRCLDGRASHSLREEHRRGSETHLIKMVGFLFRWWPIKSRQSGIPRLWCPGTEHMEREYEHSTHLPAHDTRHTYKEKTDLLAHSPSYLPWLDILQMSFAL